MLEIRHIFTNLSEDTTSSFVNLLHTRLPVVLSWGNNLLWRPLFSISQCAFLQ